MKKFLTLMLLLFVGVAWGQSINGSGPSNTISDGTNLDNTKVLVFPQVQSTPGTTPTPQTSNWITLNSAQAVQVEFSSNTFAGKYSVQVSNNPTPVSTPGTNIYTVVQDNSTWASGGEGTQTINWAYIIKSGWKYMRFLCTPETGNVGTLNISARVFKDNLNNLSVNRIQSEGIPYEDSRVLVNVSAQGAVSNYYQYKLPNGFSGFYLYQNVSAVSGASTITCTPYVKDPVSGILQAMGSGVATHATGFSFYGAAAGLTGSAPSGGTFYTFPVAGNIVIGDAITGTGNSTFTQTIVPVK